MKFIEEKHSGGVVSLIAPNVFVEEPIAITVEGRTTTLILEDAHALVAGLLTAIKTVEEHETEVGKQEHRFCFGKTRNGMSLIVQSKLGTNPLKISRIPFTGNLSQLQNMSVEMGQSILDNCHIKLFMKV